ncbi:MAG: heme o synthase [Hyphomicrobiales bacterium]|nr:heme o synthase [Hyphomicrobiales bacterium]
MDNSLASHNRPAAASIHFPNARDYLELLKPRVMSLVLFTAFVGMVGAGASTHPLLAWIALLCIALGAGAAGALNMWFDADIDAVMTRTQTRPIPQGRILPGEALGFGCSLAAGAVLTMGLLLNWSAAILLAATIAFYIFIYTMLLKRRTPLNIVIGGIAGATPPVIGALAVSGTVTLSSIFLFLIVFLWTPPHSWALALLRNREYEKVGVPMLPATHGASATCRQTLVYSLLLAGASLLPYLYDIASVFYLAVALVLNGVFLVGAVRLSLACKRGNDLAQPARFLFRFSILYLFLLLLAMLADSGIGLLA